MVMNKEDYKCYEIYIKDKDNPEVKIMRAYNYADAMRIYNSIKVTPDIEYVELQGVGTHERYGFVRDIIDMKD